ncbi:MAG: tetratricopeptide repeat protein [Bacteroidota bacterium]|nr:tetratricopeptide repeat protein [Bacteroidota bacterium]
MSKKIKCENFKPAPEVMEVRGDSFEVGFTCKMPPGSVYKKGVIKFEPVLMYGNNEEKVLQTYVVRGPSAKENADITIDDKGATFTYKTKVLYEPIMRNCTLVVIPNLKVKNYEDVLDKCLELPKCTLTWGIKYIADSFNTEEEVSIPTATNHGPEMKRKATIYYIVDTWDFKPKFILGGPKISNPSELKQFVSYLADKTSFALTGLTLNSSASPDGTYKRNTLLARNRDITIYNFVRKELKRLGYAEVSDSLFSTRIKTTEEMDGLKEALEASTLKDKQFFLDIINSSDMPDVKERKMREEFDRGKGPGVTYPNKNKQHWTSYRYILDNIMPRLRRSEVTVTGEKGVRSWAEIKDKSENQNFDSLNSSEVLRYGYQIEDMKQKEKAYRFYINKWPDDWAGYNNLGAILIMQRKYADAKQQLDKALSLSKEHGEVYNNLGICNRNMRQYDKAEENYRQAKARGINTGQNMGILSMVRGNYTEAISNFKTADKTCQYNMALSYTMNGEYDNAQKSVDCMEPKSKTAPTYYLKAVIAARANKLDELTTNLAKAISIDSKMRAKASEDKEFEAYRSRPEFQKLMNK